MGSQIKNLITADQLKSVTTDICEKTVNNFITKSEFNKEIIKVTESISADVPTKTSDLTNDSDFITSSDLPVNVSDLTNDTGFITNVVNDLVNYYLKSESYSKAEVDTIAAAIKNSRFEVVNTLPTDNIKTNVIYLVPKSNLEVGNVKEEYINLDGTTTGWERIGDTEIDLENYVSISALNNTLTDYVTSTNLNTLLASYTKSSNLARVATSGDYNDLSNKPSIPTNVSDLINDSGFISTADIPQKVSDLTNDLGFITTGDIPTTTSDLVNDAGFITANDIPFVPTKVSELTNDTGFITTGDIPSKTSDITNDSGFITANDIPFVPTKVSELTNDTGFITTGDIPSKTTDLTNDSGFITTAVNNLVNYYLKSETYNKTEVDSIISTIKTSRFEVVDELPTEDIKTNVIYIVPSSDPNAGNIKNELINLDGTSNGWEIIGSTDINLSGYITATDLNNALANYTTTSALNTLLAAYAQSSNLATVATSGDYNDLSNTPTIPTKVSDLDNDSEFISTADIPQKVSDLTNDLGFITTGDIPSKTSDITNDSGFITANDIPTNVSDFTNDSGFIANTVDSLINYYLKSEAYNKTEVDTIVSAIKNSRFEVVNSLPTEDIKTNVIYLTPSLDPSVGDIKDEYINLDGTTSGWERIASTDIKITNYINRTDLDNALADYTNTVDLTALLNAKQDQLQYSSLPTASEDYLGKVFEYVGETTNEFTHGYFYECVSDGEVPPTYSWTQKNVQPTTIGGATVMSELADVSLDLLEDNQILAWSSISGKWINTNTSLIPRSAEYQLHSTTINAVNNGSYEKLDDYTINYTVKPTSGNEGISILINGLETGLIYFIKVDIELVSGGRTSTSYSWKVGMQTGKPTSFDSSTALSGNQQALPTTVGQKITYMFEWTAAANNSLVLNTASVTSGTTVLQIKNVRAGVVGSGLRLNPVEVTPIQTEGTKIATITIDGDYTDIYAPEGGGAGGGHTIEDLQGTALEQRDTLQFGEGFIAEDDDTNEKTVITPDVMQSGDMDDVLSTLPSVRPNRSTILKQVLEAGETTITFNDIPTEGDYIVDFFNSLGINYTGVTQSTGTITLTYPEQSSDMNVYCELREV